MLITKEVEIPLNSNNVNFLENLGYLIPRRKDISGRMRFIQGTKIIVKVKDLNKNNVFVDVQCDNKECNKILNMKLNDYKRYVKEDGKYYCNSCAKKLYGNDNSNKVKLKKGKSFEQWCIENNRQGILDRWDYELNNCEPSNILYATSKKYYFKCQKGIHKSELKSISSFTSNHDGVMDCKACNSFAQWGTDNLGNDFLENYWDYEKNIFDPWVISHGNSTKKVLIKCQDKDYHGSYEVKCNSFINGSRCPECDYSKGEIRIGNYLNYKEFIKIFQEDYDELNNKYNNNYYIAQKKFNGLKGSNNGDLSYDFYLPKYNLLIEFQGKQHEKPVDFNGKGKKYAEERFKTQVEHDRRKKEYAENKKIRFLEIWYKDFDNIETILEKELYLIK